mmetsp:Transcript_28606/g.54698  ORF Transcript_28606/g.54698 Transcript_28606/m.54698 type:complete len:779 (-) Transcript_28606:394-2730(-)
MLWRLSDFAFLFLVSLTTCECVAAEHGRRDTNKVEVHSHEDLVRLSENANSIQPRAGNRARPPPTIPVVAGTTTPSPGPVKVDKPAAPRINVFSKTEPQVIPSATSAPGVGPAELEPKQSSTWQPSARASTDISGDILQVDREERGQVSEAATEKLKAARETSWKLDSLNGGSAPSDPPLTAPPAEVPTTTEVHWPVYIPGSPETNPEGAGVLTLKNVAISGGVLRTFGLPAATRRNLHMLLKSPDRPASSTPIRTVHSDSPMDAKRCTSFVPEPVLVVSTVHPGYSPLRESQDVWPYMLQAMRQAGLDATNGVAANATNAQKHRVLLFGDMRVAGISSIQKFARVKQILQGRMPYVDFKQLDFLMAHSKANTASQLCFSDLRWIWKLQTEGLQHKGLECATGSNTVHQTSAMVKEVGYIMQAGGAEACPAPSVHASTIVETSPGHFLASWFGGQAEGFPDVSIYTATYNTSASAWSKPRKVLEPYLGIPLWNPVLHAPDQDEVILFFKVGETPTTWKGGFIKSIDQGLTWQPPRMLPDGILGPIKNKPIVLSDGTVLAPSSTESETVESSRKGGTGDAGLEVWQSWVEAFRPSGDSGIRQWHRVGPVEHAQRGGSMIQPALFVDSAGRVRMLARTRMRHVAMAVSDTRGDTWGVAQPTSLRSPNSGLDAVKVVDGRVFVVYNQLTGRGSAQRGVLTLAVSTDDGQTWNSFLTLESGGENQHEFSYPAIIQSMDGRYVHITYTWRRLNIKHVVLDLTPLGTGSSSSHISVSSSNYEVE